VNYLAWIPRFIVPWGESTAQAGQWYRHAARPPGLADGPDDVLPCQAGEPEVYNRTKLSDVTLGDDADPGRGQFAPPGGSPGRLPEP